MRAEDLRKFEEDKVNGWHELRDGSRGHFVNGVLHNDRQAALVLPDGRGEWWQYGKPTGYIEPDADVSY